MRIRTFVILVFGGYALLQAGMAVWFGRLGVSDGGIALFLLVTLSMPLYLNLAFARGWPRPLWLMPLFFGYFFLSGLSLLSLGVLFGGETVLSILRGHGGGAGVIPPARQAGWILGSVLLVAGLVLFQRFRGPDVHRRTLSIPGLGQELEGFRILQLSDIHVGIFESDATLKRLRRTIDHLPYDILVFTGDMIDRKLEEVERFLSHFGDVQLREGVFAILGNHEYWIDGSTVAKRLEENGWMVLENRSARVTRNGQTLYVVGVSDPASAEGPDGGGPDPAKAFQHVSPGPGDMVVVLAHNPSLWESLRSYPATLTLSGHTHGGQIGLPFSGWSLASFFYDFDQGLFRREAGGGAQWLLVNVGTGYFGVPVRLGVSPAVELVTLSGR